MTRRLPKGMRAGGRFEEWDPSPVRYVALDMDGTLLGPGDVIAPTTRTPVIGAVADGVAVGFASGRMRNGVLHIHRDLPLPGPHIFYDGAEVRADGRTVAAWPLSPDAVEAIVAVADATATYCELYTEDGYYITRARHGAELHWQSLDQDPVGVLSEADLDQTFLKATFIGFDPDETARIERGVRGADLDIGSARAAGIDWDFLNVKMPGVHKGRALAAVANHLGLSSAEIMAVGDGANDLPMLLAAGTAVAMGQASDAVKAAAHLVTSPVEDGGAGWAVHSLL